MKNNWKTRNVFVQLRVSVTVLRAVQKLFVCTSLLLLYFKCNSMAYCLFLIIAQVWSGYNLELGCSLGLLRPMGRWASSRLRRSLPTKIDRFEKNLARHPYKHLPTKQHHTNSNRFSESRRDRNVRFSAEIEKFQFLHLMLGMEKFCLKQSRYEYEAKCVDFHTAIVLRKWARESNEEGKATNFTFSTTFAH